MPPRIPLKRICFPKSLYWLDHQSVPTRIPAPGLLFFAGSTDREKGRRSGKPNPLTRVRLWQNPFWVPGHGDSGSNTNQRISIDIKTGQIKSGFYMPWFCPKNFSRCILNPNPTRSLKSGSKPDSKLANPATIYHPNLDPFCLAQS